MAGTLILRVACLYLKMSISCPNNKTNMRTKGKIASWNDERGFGFISPIAGGKLIFVHISAFGNRNRRPEVDQLVTYALSTDNQGRPCAVDAALGSDHLTQKTKQNNGSLAAISTAVFLIIVGFSVFVSKIPPIILAIYVVASLLTFVVYAVDKSAAKKGAWRTQESTLHLLAIIGGWPGALIAQQKLRHKSKKQSFRIMFWLTVLLNCGFLVWLFTPVGAAKLQSIITHLS